MLNHSFVLDSFFNDKVVIQNVTEVSHSIKCVVYFQVSVMFICCILTFDPAKHAIPKMAEVHIPLAWASLADKMGQGKIPRYSHRLMHRKRVTCELHDSYFSLMTIKHAIPKIEWAIELLYNSVKTGSQLVFGDQKLEIRCDRESQHSAESWAPGPPIEQPWRTRKTQRWWP